MLLEWVSSQNMPLGMTKVYLASGDQNRRASTDLQIIFNTLFNTFIVFAAKCGLKVLFLIIVRGGGFLNHHYQRPREKG